MPVKKGERNLVVRGESGIAGRTRNKEIYAIALDMAEQGRIPLNNEEGFITSSKIFEDLKKTFGTKLDTLNFYSHDLH